MTATFATGRPGLSVDADKVKAANRKLYDAVAQSYESLDGRRDAALEAWVRARLSELATRHGRELLVDIGSGSGLVVRAARGLFRRTLALDLSPRILQASSADHRLAADVDAIPLTDRSASVVTCFAVLHHLYDTNRLAAELGRVLAPGGVFWSDHDMEATFHDRFRWPLALYRRLRRADQKYVAAGSDIDEWTYALAEYRENGVDSVRFARELRDAGLAPSVRYHWFGLTRTTNRLFGNRTARRGWAPLLSIVARKPIGNPNDAPRCLNLPQTQSNHL